MLDLSEARKRAKARYEAETANHPTIHCNRFRTWEELSTRERVIRTQEERKIDAQAER